MSKNTYEVVISAEHIFKVSDMNSPEEAESVAEGMFEDGDEGEIGEVEVVDVYPSEDEDETN